jgi:hypothetical protein
VIDKHTYLLFRPFEEENKVKRAKAIGDKALYRHLVQEFIMEEERAYKSILEATLQYMEISKEAFNLG